MPPPRSDAQLFRSHSTKIGHMVTSDIKGQVSVYPETERCMVVNVETPMTVEFLGSSSERAESCARCLPAYFPSTSLL